MSTIDPAPPHADVTGLPADPTRYRKKSGGLGFWLLILSWVVVAALGVGATLYAPVWFSKGASKVSQAAPAVPWRASNAEPVETAILAQIPAGAAGLVPSGPAPADVASLATRLERLESGQDRLAQAASAALATSALVQAAQTSRPFAGELASVNTLLPQTPDVAALRTIAQTGAPTRNALAAEFPAAAARAIAAAKAPADDEGVIAHLRQALGRIVTIRRIDYVKGDGPHAVLARAESMVNEGDIEGALAELDGLPAPGREALGGWRTRAEHRAEVDRRLANIREASMRSLREGLESRP